MPYLIQCPTCQKDVSTDAPRCPHCGRDIKLYLKRKYSTSEKESAIEKATNKITFSVAGVVLLIFLMLLIPHSFASEVVHLSRIQEIFQDSKFYDANWEQRIAEYTDLTALSCIAVAIISFVLIIALIKFIKKQVKFIKKEKAIVKKIEEERKKLY